MILNNDHRTVISKALIEHRFNKAEAELREREQDLAHKLYFEAYSEEERKQMSALPKGFLPTSDRIHVRIAGEHTQLELPCDWPRPYDSLHRCQLVLDADNPLATEWLKLRGDKQDLTQQIKEARARIEGVLRSVRTTKQLLEAWPEVGPYLPAQVPSQLPAIRTEALNRMLNLP